MRVVSLFSGIGGLDKGFEDTGFEVIWANDFDKYGATCSNRYRCNPSNGWDTHGFRLTINL